MNRMNKKSLVVLVVGVFLMTGCGDSDGDTQIDAMGRAAVNTALINTFASDAARGISEDDYNSTGNFDRARFAPVMAAQFAIYDALVGACGDNPLTNRASANPADGLQSGPDRYAFISAVFADDHLYVNGNSGGAVAGQCNQYLSAELGVVGVTGFEADCGGRTPTQDVIQTTYSAVAIGGVSGVNDGVLSDNAAHSLTVFPFLAPAS